MKAGKDNLQTSRTHEARPASIWSYYIIAIAIALISVRIFVWILVRSSIVGEADSNLLTLTALPVSLLVIRRLAPSRKG